MCQGATIRRDEVTGEIYIARVIHGGLADRSGEIKLCFMCILCNDVLNMINMC